MLHLGPDKIVTRVCHRTINSGIGRVEERAAGDFAARHHFELDRIPNLRFLGSIESVSIFPLRRIEGALIYGTRRRRIEGVTVLPRRSGKRELGGSRRRIVGIRIGVRRRLLSPRPLLAPILKTERGDGENRRRDCQE